MVKVMTGYHPWTMERQPGLDAFVPILADGVKWMGYFPKPRVFFSLGWFGDELSENEKFATYDHQVVTRVGWLPIASEAEKTVCTSRSWAASADPTRAHTVPFEARGQPRPLLRRDPEDRRPIVPAPPAIETYYRKGRGCSARSTTGRTSTRRTAGPLFHGGDVVVTWLITGETRGYNAPGAFFEPVSPERPVFEGGREPGRPCCTSRYTDLDAATSRAASSGA